MSLTIAIFCGSSSGKDARYLDAAREVGHVLATRNIEIVYGGGHVGLMGAVADAALAAGGVVIGVMPRALVEREIAHHALTKLLIVDSMHERKAKIAELAGAFVALPGGAGTLDEIVVQWTWAQLGIHEKPCGFINVGGYFDPLRKMTDRMIAEGFLQRDHADILFFEKDIAALLTKFASYQPPRRKWATPAARKAPRP